MELLTFAEVARVVKKTVRGVRKDVAAGRFGPDVMHIGGGRSVRVRADELAEWIRAGCPARDKWLALRDAPDAGRKGVAR